MRHREATRRGLLPRPPAEGSGPRAGVRVSRSGSSRSIRASATPRTLTMMSQRNSSISRAISGRAASTARWLSRLSRIEGSASSSAEASRMFARMAAIVWRSDTVPSCRARSARGGFPIEAGAMRNLAIRVSARPERAAAGASRSQVRAPRTLGSVPASADGGDYPIVRAPKLRRQGVSSERGPARYGRMRRRGASSSASVSIVQNARRRTYASGLIAVRFARQIADPLRRTSPALGAGERA